jgi:hypothetical protein
MRFTDEEHLYSYIAELMTEGNIDFVACPIISPLHAIGVDVLVYDILQQKKEKPSGVVVINDCWTGKFMISEADFICRDFATVEFHYLNSGSSIKELTISRQTDLARKAFDILAAIRKLKKTAKESKREIRIVTALFPNVFILRAFRSKKLACKYYPIFSLIDEGLGVYLSEKEWRVADKLLATQGKEPGWFQVTRFLRMKMMYNAANLMRIIGGKCLAIEKRFLLEQNHGKLIPNRHLADSYRNMLERKGATHKRAEKNNPMAILVTDPLLEDDEATLAAESNFLEAIISSLLERGIAVVIKPHPNEAVNKYNYISTRFKSGQVRLAEQKVAAEILFSALKPDCVIGYDSSSLVYASIIYNIPAIRITDILLSEVNLHLQPPDVGRKSFERLTRGILYSADNFEKLKQILNSVVSSGAANTTIDDDKIA